jgi:fructokinase
MSHLVVGEALVDIVVPQDGAVREAPGGSPMNVAVGLARLGIDTSFLTRIGDDPYGARIRRHLSESGVRLVDGSVVSGSRTATATAHLDATGAATYEFDLAWDMVARALPQGTSALHIGSIGTAVEPGREAVADLVQDATREGLVVSFDPNMRTAFLGPIDEEWTRFLAWAAHARIVKMSDEDLALLAPGATPADVAEVVFAHGMTDVLVVTLGGEGAEAYTRRHRARVPVPASDRVVDTVGAGDSFMAALLAIVDQWGAQTLPDLDEAGLGTLVRGAATAAAVTCTRPGADPPRRTELPRDWPR